MLEMSSCLLFLLHPAVSIDVILLTEVKMAEDIQNKLENYRTAPFDARFPNQNQTRNCWSNYLGKTAGQGQRSQIKNIKMLNVT